MTDNYSSDSWCFLGTRAFHLYFLHRHFVSIFWNRLKLLCPFLPTVTNPPPDLATHWILQALHYFLAYPLLLLQLGFPISSDECLLAGQEHGCWLADSGLEHRGQTCPCHHTVLREEKPFQRKIISSPLSYWWRNSRPRGQSSFPTVTQEGSEQDPALSPSIWLLTPGDVVLCKESQ